MNRKHSERDIALFILAAFLDSEKFCYLLYKEFASVKVGVLSILMTLKGNYAIYAFAEEGANSADPRVFEFLLKGHCVDDGAAH